jgi:hypothetical protein
MKLIYTYVYIYLFIYMYTYNTYICVYMNAYTYICIYVYSYICIHINSDIYIYLYICIYIPSVLFSDVLILNLGLIPRNSTIEGLFPDIHCLKNWNRLGRLLLIEGDKLERLDPPNDDNDNDYLNSYKL